MHGNHAVRTLQIDLRHKRARAQANQGANGVLHPRVADGAKFGRDTRVDAGAEGSQKVENEAPAAGLAALGDNAKRARVNR